MTLSDTTTGNHWLEGNFAPLTEEVTAFELPVKGRLPAELTGRLLRNGPNPIGPVDPATYHWFLGEGMVHGLRLRDGRAEWYRARHVRGSEVTAALGEPSLPGPFPERGSSPNTSVVAFAGNTLAIVEAGALPVLLDYELNSLARTDFDGTLPGAFTAHPKLDPGTGELHAMCYRWPEGAGHVQYVVVAPDGKVRRTVDIPVPGMTMLHDMALTERYALVFDLPVTIDPGLAATGHRFPFAWNSDYGARVGLLPRERPASEIVWCEVEPCYVFHPLNAYDTPDGRVVVDVCRYERLFDWGALGPDHVSTLDRWTIDPVRRRVTEERVDERGHEFPRLAPELLGRPHRFGYTAGLAPGFHHGATYRHDLARGVAEVHEHGPGRAGAEPVPVPRVGGAEGEEWVLVLVHDQGTDRSELVVLDGADFTAPPVARVLLPNRVPNGFHGNWIPDTDVPEGS
jgi:carotenoid cleavage dioxygenase-like enzyme